MEPAQVVAAGGPVALVASPDGVAIASAAGTAAVNEFEQLRDGGDEPRWVVWSAAQVTSLVGGGARLRAAWDLAAVGRLLYGGGRDDPGAVWAAAHGLPAPAPVSGELDLFDLDGEDADEPVRRDGQLSRVWQHGRWGQDLAAAQRWAALALDVHRRQEAAVADLPDPRPVATRQPLALLTAHAESAAALLAVELGKVGLPVDRRELHDLLEPVIGPPPVDEADAAAQRRARDEAVRAAFPQSEGVDLRNPAKVRDMLVRVGLDLPDTRSWRLEPHAATSPAIAALLEWRRAERLSTTYGWSWLERNIGADGRLHGHWSAAEGAGRMTASAGLHNLPAELRPAVRAKPGHVLVRADLGQVEPRVLAVVSGDDALAEAAREDDMYAPVAERLRCDRPTAKVAVLAAMYGSTTGTAANALRQMDRTYPRAMRYLREAEAAGARGEDVRTYGGRLLRMRPGWGRFARNAVVQGAAAELFKAWAATVRVLLPDAGRIVLCLHDELLLHVPAEAAEATVDLVHYALASTARWWAAGSGVRFVADVSSAAAWPAK